MVYAAMSSVHDLYAGTAIARMGPSTAARRGDVLHQSRTTWSRLKNLGKPIVGLAMDPTTEPPLRRDGEQHSGGIYRTLNLQAGSASTWTKLAAPPALRGILTILKFSTTVAWSPLTRRGFAASNFQPSSGFSSARTTAQTGSTGALLAWQYYTKDLTVDPHDPSQSKWYAGSGANGVPRLASGLVFHDQPRCSPGHVSLRISRRLVVHDQPGVSG
jgi:hypothetical protein